MPNNASSMCANDQAQARRQHSDKMLDKDSQIVMNSWIYCKRRTIEWPMFQNNTKSEFLLLR